MGLHLQNINDKSLLLLYKEQMHQLYNIYLLTIRIPKPSNPIINIMTESPTINATGQCDRELLYYYNNKKSHTLWVWIIHNSSSFMKLPLRLTTLSSFSFAVGVDVRRSQRFCPRNVVPVNNVRMRNTQAQRAFYCQVWNIDTHSLSPYASHIVNTAWGARGYNNKIQQTGYVHAPQQPDTGAL